MRSDDSTQGTTGASASATAAAASPAGCGGGASPRAVLAADVAASEGAFSEPPAPLPAFFFSC